MNRALLTETLRRSPFVAILRGVTPDAVEGIAQVLVDEGVGIIEVPLNSPQPFDSIYRLVQKFGSSALIGAGTVLSVADVGRVRDTGATVVISPNVNVDVIHATSAAGLISLPGYFTPTEAFTAIDAGATGLKLFPSEAASPGVLKAHRAVLPSDVPILAVGGITPDNVGQWRNVAQGFGLGSALYAPGSTADEVRNRIRRFNAAL
jgi:2-dehydro-3-deoxyphosphogalactonate aldolase